VAALEATPGLVTLDCADKTTRSINETLRQLVAEGVPEITLHNPGARHNLAVALFGRVKLTFAGSVGYYGGGMMDGPTLHIRGNCGWGLGEDMLAGRILVDRNASNSVAAAIRGGTVYVAGNAGARAGIAMKGGLLVVRGNVGYMTGFMMQKGTIVVGGDAAEGLGDSMYEGRIFVAGRIAELGSDAVEQELTPEDERFLAATVAEFDLPTGPARFRKIEAGRRLWNFDKKEIELWKTAL
jgi:glutamate synthase domain-containing protein 3